MKLRIVGAGLLSLATLSACGGGGDETVPMTVTVPAAEAVTVKKEIRIGVDAAVAEVVRFGIQRIEYLDVRCATLLPDPLGNSNLQLLQFVVLIEVAAGDVEKTKALGFSVFTAAEKARKLPDVCR